MHGSPPGDIRNVRNMPYGVPACPVYSPFSVRCAGSLKTACGISFTFAARLFVFTISRCRDASYA